MLHRPLGAAKLQRLTERLRYARFKQRKKGEPIGLLNSIRTEFMHKISAFRTPYMHLLL